MHRRRPRIAEEMRAELQVLDDHIQLVPDRNLRRGEGRALSLDLALELKAGINKHKVLLDLIEFRCESDVYQHSGDLHV